METLQPNATMQGHGAAGIDARGPARGPVTHPPMPSGAARGSARRNRRGATPARLPRPARSRTGTARPRGPGRGRGRLDRVLARRSTPGTRQDGGRRGSRASRQHPGGQGAGGRARGGDRCRGRRVGSGASRTHPRGTRGGGARSREPGSEAEARRRSRRPAAGSRRRAPSTMTCRCSDLPAALSLSKSSDASPPAPCLQPSEPVEEQRRMHEPMGREGAFWHPGEYQGAFNPLPAPPGFSSGRSSATADRGIVRVDDHRGRSVALTRSAALTPAALSLSKRSLLRCLDTIRCPLPASLSLSKRSLLRCLDTIRCSEPVEEQRRLARMSGQCAGRFTPPCRARGPDWTIPARWNSPVAVATRGIFRVAPTPHPARSRTSNGHPMS